MFDGSLTMFRAIFAILTIFCIVGDAANVAVINTYLTHSHFAFLIKLTDILTDEGHNVTMIVTELDKSRDTPMPKKARIIVRSEFSSNPMLHGKSEQTFWNDGFEFMNTRQMYTQYTTAIEAQCERFLTDSEFIESMKSEKFDIAMIEPSDFCGYGFLKLIGLENYVNVFPMALSEKFALALGLPGRTFEPFPSAYDYHPELSYWERLTNYFYPILLHYVNTFDEGGISASVVRKYVDPNFHMNDAVGHARFTFLNTEEHMDFPRPISHKVIYVGGITVANSSADDLAEDYKQIFETSKKGVVLVSFGTVAKASLIPPKIKQAFLSMFAAFPEISFIWKYENTSDTVANDLPNVFKKPWIPQSTVLAHLKMLAFITHGGMNSVMEAGHAGVPLLGVPLFGDQARNLKMLEYRKIAITIDKTELTASNLIAAMHKLTDDDSYRTRARTIAALARTKPLSGKQRFIAYFNHAVQFVHAEDHLDIGHRKLDTFRYYNLDIYLTILAVVFVLIATSILLSFYIVIKPLIILNNKPLSTKIE